MGKFEQPDQAERERGWLETEKEREKNGDFRFDRFSSDPRPPEDEPPSEGLIEARRLHPDWDRKALSRLARILQNEIERKKREREE